MSSPQDKWTRKIVGIIAQLNKDLETVLAKLTAMEAKVDKTGAQTDGVAEQVAAVEDSPIRSPMSPWMATRSATAESYPLILFSHADSPKLGARGNESSRNGASDSTERP